MPGRPITFLSDFGLADEFVGVVHAVVERIAPGTRVIDLGHDVPRGDVRAGALALLRSVQYLPDGVVLAVVDPGVGTARAAVAVETAAHAFVGPDNGVLAPAVAMVGGALRAVRLEAPEFRLPGQGTSFDGRDVFAPAAAVLASGEASLDDLGPEVDPGALQSLLLPLVESGDGVAQGEVWWVDRFGNAQTNVSPDDLAALGVGPGDTVEVRVGSAVHAVPWVGAYGEVAPGSPLLHADSHGLMALAVRGGSAASSLKLHTGLSIGLARSPGATG
ncbi:MAG: SAM-dependent chlorinase/fluorinase [Actinobacteria bacterium]|nr:SAM-dependent chlorinase/fluorinase [Actinomycetota bacterium]